MRIFRKWHSFHSCTKWEAYTYPVKRTYRGQVFDGIEEIQQRQCTKCGIVKSRHM